MIDTMRFMAATIAISAMIGWAQGLPEVVGQGEKVFNQTCATGYCHALKGGSGGGAPRLAGRGFDEAYINTTTTRGLPGTAMPAFGGEGAALSRSDLLAVVAYVATLNGIATPVAGSANRAGVPLRPSLPPEAARGRELFFDAVRGFGRCSTCHEVGGVGIPAASPISKVPSDVKALWELATPAVHTATMDGESIPVLVVSQGKTRTIFYDVASSPPVLRTVDPGAATIADGSPWRHAFVLAAYNDSELSSILTYLRAMVKPQ